MSGSQRSWLITQCENLRGHIIARELATQAEVDGVWPDDEGDDRDWIIAYGWFRAWRYVESLGEGGKEDAKRRVTEILRDEPKDVTLPDGTVFKCYPKSFHCLLWFRERDWLLAYLTNYLADLKTARALGTLPKAISNPDDLVNRIIEELGKQMADILAVATSPGPQLPDPIVPLHDLSPLDFYFVHEGFIETNTLRLSALDRIVKPQGGRGDTGWNVFYGTMSQKLGKPAAALMKDQSMASLVAEARLSIPDMEGALAGN